MRELFRFQHLINNSVTTELNFSLLSLSTIVSLSIIKISFVKIWIVFFNLLLNINEYSIYDFRFLKWFLPLISYLLFGDWYFDSHGSINKFYQYLDGDLLNYKMNLFFQIQNLYVLYGICSQFELYSFIFFYYFLDCFVILSRFLSSFPQIKSLHVLYVYVSTESIEIQYFNFVSKTLCLSLLNL